MISKGPIYSLINEDGCCSVNGRRATTCENYSVFSLSDCEAACTTHEPCVGYLYSYGFCYLIPSTHSCPTGYDLYLFSLGTPATSDDLEADRIHKPAGGGWVCYGKNLSNIDRSN